MSMLAIKGHLTRGEKVIEILGMLGGSNAFNHTCDNISALYYIDEIYKNFIICSVAKTEHDYRIFTLEEFLEKFPYKIGDRVRIPEYESEVCISKMYWDGNEVQYEVVTDEVEWYSAKELNEFNEPNKKETRKEIKVDISKGCKFVGVDAQQVVFEKVKPKYPKTYEECVELDGTNFAKHLANPMNKYGNLLLKFNELLLCRDAYWKLYGERMGLGKPWDPDWSNSTEIKYCITTIEHTVEYFESRTVNIILAFPTEEMRDAFDENFKNIIEQCKELL